MKYLSFLDYATLEARGKNIEAKLYEREREIQSMNGKYNLLQSQVQTILSNLGNMDQSSKNQLAKQLFKNGVYDKMRKP
jgi:hypothetical protein